MKKMKWVWVLPAICLYACNNPKPEEKTTAQPAVKITRPDAEERAFNDGRYYMVPFIRLQPDSSRFIVVDSEYVATRFTDENAKHLYFDTEILLPETREAFYATMVSALPPEDKAIHELVWNLPEMRSQSVGAEGGLYTLLTWITAWPTEEEPYYTVDVKRNYYNRLGTCIPIPSVRIHAKTRAISVYNTIEDAYLPLETWRKLED